jgi:hypothetical protein
MTDKPEFALADKAITFAAAKIEQAMVELLQTALPLSHVVPTDYVVERLVYGLLERNPGLARLAESTRRRPLDASRERAHGLARYVGRKPIIRPRPSQPRCVALARRQLLANAAIAAARYENQCR